MNMVCSMMKKGPVANDLLPVLFMIKKLLSFKRKTRFRFYTGIKILCPLRGRSIYPNVYKNDLLIISPCWIFHCTS